MTSAAVIDDVFRDSRTVVDNPPPVRTNPPVADSGTVPDLSMNGFPTDLNRLFRNPTINRAEQRVAKTACRAMEAFYAGTGQHDNWSQAIRNQLAPESDEDILIRSAVDSAVNSAANAIAAFDYGPLFAKAYFATCHGKRLKQLR